MYRMSDFEFIQYLNAEEKLKQIKKENALEIQQLYDNIHPTKSAFDYELGRIYAETINTAEYAIYIADLRTEHRRYENWWELRANAYREAINQLTSEEQVNLISGTYELKEIAYWKLKNELSDIITTKPELQRPSVLINDDEETEEADREIEQMSKKEILKDYVDAEKEYLKKMCTYFYQVKNWPLDKIGKRLRISTTRVKEYINTTDSVKPVKPSKISSLHSEVTITYLTAEELDKYRSGEHGGSKWFSYDDYLRMRKDGLNYKEIAVEMGIDPSILFKRLRAWKKEKSKYSNISS